MLFNTVFSDSVSEEKFGFKKNVYSGIINNELWKDTYWRWSKVQLISEPVFYSDNIKKLNTSLQSIVLAYYKATPHVIIAIILSWHCPFKKKKKNLKWKSEFTLQSGGGCYDVINTVHAYIFRSLLGLQYMNKLVSTFCNENHVFIFRMVKVFFINKN